MVLRIGPGPVFVYESLVLSRRREVYAGRAFFVFIVLIGLATAWFDAGAVPLSPGGTGGPSATLQMMASTGRKFYSSMAGIQLAMVLLLAPAASAGAICHDRARGIFAQLAMTDLSDAEIVLGKLGSRLAPIVGVLLCGLPVTALAALLGGIDPQALFILFVVSVAVAVLGCSLALAISLRAAKIHEVIILVLALEVLWLLSVPIWAGASAVTGVMPPPDWFKKGNPFVLVYAPYAWPGYVAPSDVAIFVGAVLLFSTAVVARTIALVRRNVLEPIGRVRDVAAAGKFRLSRWLEWLPGPSLDGNPVLWREWHRNRPSRWMRIIWTTYVVTTVVGVGTGIHESIQYGLGGPSGSFAIIMAVHFQFLFGLLIMSSVAPTSLAEEQVRGSLDVLMTTPLSTRSILWGKWLGTYRLVLGLAVLPGLASVVVACLAPPVPARFMVTGRPTAGVNSLGLVDRIAAPCLIVGQMLSYGAAITSVGLALATWVRRLGRAIAINVLIFFFFAVGWPLLLDSFVSPVLGWLGRQIREAMMLISPLIAPIVTLQGLLDTLWSDRWRMWLFAQGWCVVAAAFSAAVFWAAVKSFDRCMGRTPETSVSEDYPLDDTMIL
jgi:ABC-type transport system involved in multi-copper enzyme maturation permease subunit